MRKATLINQDWLRSKTMALAGDTIENIAFRLLLVSDDFGRFPHDPDGLRVMMNDIRHNAEIIAEAINYLIEKGTIEKYEADGQAVCCWVKWENYQNIKWHDDAKYPDMDGTYEVSNNPQTVAKRTDRRNVQRVVKRGGKRAVQQSEKEKEKEEEKEKEPGTSVPEWCVELIKKLFPEVKPRDIAKQAETIEQLFRLDCYTQEEIEKVLRWARTDTGDGSWAGWSVQFLSCAPLRKKRDDSSKFAKMKAGHDAAKQAIQAKFPQGEF